MQQNKFYLKYKYILIQGMHFSSQEYFNIFYYFIDEIKIENISNKNVSIYERSTIYNFVFNHHLKKCNNTK